MMNIVAAPRTITGEIATRRSMGRHLAFATIRPTVVPGAAAAAAAAAAAEAAAEGSDETAIAVVFSSPCFAEEGAAGRGSSAFPTKRSHLRLGDAVTLSVMVGADVPGGYGSGFADQLMVLGWSSSGQGGGRAVGRLASDAAALTIGGGDDADLIGDATLGATGGGLGVELCGAWALLGECGCDGCDYRHDFVSTHERSIVQKARARKGRWVQL
jgi:hypothetical protein